VKHGTVFVLDAPQIGLMGAEIVSTGAEIVIESSDRGGFCAARLVNRAGWFLC